MSVKNISASGAGRGLERRWSFLWFKKQFVDGRNCSWFCVFIVLNVWGWHLIGWAVKLSQSSLRDHQPLSKLLTLTASHSWNECVFVRKSVCLCACVYPHTYTNCGVSYIRGTLTPLFCVKTNKKENKSDSLTFNNLASSFCFFLNPWPKLPWREINNETKTKTEKNVHVRRPTWSTTNQNRAERSGAEQDRLKTFECSTPQSWSTRAQTCLCFMWQFRL